MTPTAPKLWASVVVSFIVASVVFAGAVFGLWLFFEAPAFLFWGVLFGIVWAALFSMIRRDR